ncbi:hypothetical protein NQ318_013849 [Aromia moschata]|uniref:Aminopeptidase n=1 Tax=Aromia moschata TaxID=1265417 RepID=A0AAV8Z8P2_9CUCU|nr:hypothetical protein NQ318_013849 [Aromia moschata]
MPKFRAGDLDVTDAPRSGRPDDDQIKALIETDPHSTPRDIAETFIIPQREMALAHFIVLALIIGPTLPLPRSSKARVEDYRLPTWYEPLAYRIQLSFPPEAFTPTGYQFSGSITVTFTVSSPVNYISLHSQHDFVSITSLGVSTAATTNATSSSTNVTSPAASTNVAISGFSTNNITDILTITLGSNLTVGVTYLLTVEYSSLLSTNDMYGIYKSSYAEGNATKYLVTSQFAATFARRAFPCFDEPPLKATFDLSVTAPSGLTVLSNTEQINSSTNAVTGLKTSTFNTTPRMSTYLLALVVSELTCTTRVSVGTTPYQVCSRNETEDIRGTALEYGPKLLASLNNFTNYDYNQSINILDQVAIPDFAAGAMENWGLVTYRETALLWNQEESSNRYLQRVVTVIAHELSHQWFGNLVTAKWWSEIFLNEGFATYFEYHTAHEVVSSWQLDKQFVIEQLHTALSADAAENAQSLLMACSTPAEIISRFGTISYNKGGSILRMVEHFMQLDNFRSGLQNYLLTHEYNNTEPEDLWLALNASVDRSVSKLPADLLTVMDSWRRFLLSNTDSASEWYVPISYTTSAKISKINATTPDVWLVPDQDVSVTLPPGTSWIILNNQQSAYYRVNYDNVLWSRIRTALLRENFDGISELNRAQIVDDLFQLARADHLTYWHIFDLMRFLYNDVSYYTWYPAFSGYNFLLRRVGEGSELGSLISIKILELMGTLYRSVPLTELREDDQIYTLNQVMTHTWACRLGAPSCINEVREQFTEYRSTGIRPNRNFRAMVYCYGLKYSDDSTDWDFLWAAYVNASDLATEQVTILASLGCTTDAALLRGYLTKSITDGSGIRPQDGLQVFVSVYTGSSVGIDVAFEFLVENYETIAAKYQSMNSLETLITGIAQSFTTQVQVDRLRNFTDKDDLPESLRVSANAALETAESNLRWLEKYEYDLTAYYSGVGRVGSSLFAIVLAVICVYVTK